MTQLTALSGIELIDARLPELWAEMDRQNMPTMHATLYIADERMADSDGDGGGAFREVATAGVDVIPTDLHLEAYEALSHDQDTPAAFAPHAAPLADGQRRPPATKVAPMA